MKQTRAPLIVSEDVKYRSYGLNGAIGKHYNFETRRMTLKTFSKLLQNYLAWGYKIGKSDDLFKFHFFLFVNKELQKSTNNKSQQQEEALRFINCQASVALSALWWMRETRKESKEEINEDQFIDAIAAKLSPLIVPRVTYRRNLKSEPLKRWRKVVRTQSKVQIREFLQGAAVRRAFSTEFTAAAEPWLTSDEAPWPADTYDSAVVEALAPEIQQRISKLDEAAGWLTWLFVRPTEFDEKSWSKAMVKGRAADRVLDEVIAALDGDDFSDAGHIEQVVLGVGDALTEALDARRADHGWRHRDTRLAELIGDMQIIKESRDKHTEAIRTAVRPGGLLTSEIAVLDDISRAPGEALNVILRILNERKFGGEHIPLLTVLATGNPCTELFANEQIGRAHV